MTNDRKCPSCGGTLFFDPGWNRLICEKCGYKETIEELVSKVPVPENDFVTAQTHASHDWGMETQVISCVQCGGQIVSNKLMLSGRCPFCGSTTLVQNAPSGEPLLAPNGIIPFKIREIRAENIFKDWLKERFWAPDQLKEKADLQEFTGIYVPFYTFDFDTNNTYTGRFYDAIRDADGTLRRSNSRDASGAFTQFIDDFPVVASNVIASDRLLVSVMGYVTSEAAPYTPEALAGFPAEHYSVGLAEAWGRAMNDVIPYLKESTKKLQSADCHDNVQLATTYTNIKYKYLLVPVWISSFIFENKIYHIVINGQTGKIAGQWPKSFGGFLKDLFGRK